MADHQKEQQQQAEPLPRDYGIPMNPGSEKTEWPELVGLMAEEAEERIKEEKGRVGIISVIPPDSFITMDFNTTRVRLFIDSQGKVARTPKIG